MTPDAVASYLQEHPEFFESHADLLADIYIPHPHGGRAIPISERQILTLRERGRQLEAKLREVMQFGEENDAIGEKVHRLALALLTAVDVATLVNAVKFNLREDFAVPHVALRAWSDSVGDQAGELANAGAATREYVAALAGTYCGGHVPEPMAADLFGETAPQLKSFSVIPLRSQDTSGVLVLASEDAQRFYSDMGTMYLKRIGDMVATALARHLSAQ
jgi:uncharacterized protein YigA (DUF484 family)